MGQKNPKGSVSIAKAAGRIRLRWRYHGERYSLNLFAYSKTALLEAKKTAVQIEKDIVLETFDLTLNRYRPQTSQPEGSSATPLSLLELFQRWTSNYRHKSCEKDIDYYAVYRMFLRWGSFTPNDIVFLLNAEAIAARTYNRRLTMLKAFFAWTTKQTLTATNPLEDVRRKKMVKTEKPKRQPFSSQDIARILDAFRNDTCTPNCSAIKYSFYYPFVYFIFKTGVRNAEAIGLRVKNIHLDKGFVDIKEVMARTLKGTHAAARVRKETKNGKERKLPLDAETISILSPLLQGKALDDLVFHSPKGGPIDDKAFQRRIFKKVLKQLDIQERVLYACRHSFGSRCMHEGLTPVMTAFLMGNDPETALRNYTHLLDTPKALPSLAINRDQNE